MRRPDSESSSAADQRQDASSAAQRSALSAQRSALLVEGVLRDGLRVAAQFTELPWVREQFRRKLGLDIWPGTVNLQVQDAAGLAFLARLRQAPNAPGGVASGVPIEPPDVTGPSATAGPGGASREGGPTYCVGYCFPARLDSLPAAVVVPHVPDYPADKLELVAAVRVREALGLQPGDRVMVTIFTAPNAPTPTPLPGGEGLSGPGDSASAPPLPEGESSGTSAPPPRLGEGGGEGLVP